MHFLVSPKHATFHAHFKLLNILFPDTVRVAISSVCAVCKAVRARVCGAVAVSAGSVTTACNYMTTEPVCIFNSNKMQRATVTTRSAALTASVADGDGCGVGGQCSVLHPSLHLDGDVHQQSDERPYEPSSGIKLTAYSCICWLFHRMV